MSDSKMERRKSQRKPSSVEAELYLESSVFKTQAIDVSDNGVRLQLNKPIRFHIRIRIGDKLVSRTAEMIWSEDVGKETSLSYGFKYIE
ncbi:hypothetical protein ES708_09765 [subsurface metagenome]